ncbi:TniQ family protein [Rhizobium leguminosarum]|uniref:TniQ family protein n=1 Tax=Rhizobium leguminosarum TaxID=384 RepID=UPI001F419FD1|nr:TniQ family protein [Rhizobium leguminosarum]UIJ81744.1 TniQ family protein [Rhizobium leguminosarum]
MVNRFPTKPSETLLGFAARYARERNTRLPQFMRLTGIKIWHYPSFEAAVSRLAAMSGNTFEELALHALRMEDGWRHKLLGELIDRRDVVRDAARYCPHCLTEDHAQGGRRPFTNVFCRAAWMHARIEVCSEHRIRLHTISQKYPGYAGEDFTSAVMDNWAEVTSAAANPMPVEITGYDRYFSQRLNGIATSNDLLDDMPCYAALRICEIVGAMATGGDRQALSTHSFEALQVMSKTGFDLLSEGYVGLRAFLEKMDSLNVGNDDKSVGTRLYGKLYEYLYDNADRPGFAAVVNFVRDHAFDAHPLGPENNFLGHGGVRKFHSVRSAFTEYGIHPVTVRKLLTAEGLLDDETSPVRDLKVSIDVGTMERIIASWKDSVPMTFARERLDASPQVIRQLVDAGILSAATEKSDHDLKRLFSRAEIEGLVTRLDSLATSGDAPGMVPLKNCVPFMSFVDQLRGILEGRIPFSVSKPDGKSTTLEHLLVDINAVKAVAGVGIPGGYVATNFMTTRLVALADTVSRLASAGVFGTIQYRSGNGLTVTAYSEESVRAFLKDHITFRKLARGKEHYAKTEKRVSGVTPVYDFGGFERIYRKADVFRE